ncbi:hypothetical protein [Teredinibacter turnerae]|uniref:hypothetical protein n=1 Tax=Teredinibacter turnerae TaxID=2426 RepID=UPI00048D18EB|nr:hypothetical protein [Teredinibacter turnerae]
MTKYILIVLMLLVGFVGFTFFLAPHKVSPGRMASAEMVMCTAELRSVVGAALLEGKSIPINYKMECDMPEIAVALNSVGEIDVKNSEYGIFIRFTPQIEGNAVIWSCEGEPNNYIPAACKLNT